MLLGRPLVALHVNLHRIEDGLRTVHIVPAILEVVAPAGVLDLRVLERQEEELRRAAQDAQEHLKQHNAHRHLRLVVETVDIDVYDLRENEAEEVDQQEPLNELLRVLKLPVDDFLHRFLLEEVQIRLAVAEEVSEEEIVNVVKFLRLLVDPAKILRIV